MKERGFDVNPLVKLQRATWYVVLIYFAAIVALSLIGIPNVFEWASYGIIFILVATAAKLVVMAAQFRKSGLKRFEALSYVLILILAAIVAGRYLF